MLQHISHTPPFPTRQENINMVKVLEENMDVNKKWEAEHLAREQRSQRYEKERDDKAKAREERQEQEQEKGNDSDGRFQYMVDVQSGGDDESPLRNEAAEDAENELAFLDKENNIQSMSNHSIPAEVAEVWTP